MAHDTTQPMQMERLLSVKDVRILLGVSKSSVYRMVERREIPFYRLASGLRFRLSEIEAHLELCRIKAIDNHNVYGRKNH